MTATISEQCALLFTDVVDSTHSNVRWGDPAMARFWAAHDHAARDLIRMFHGREIGRSDGILVLFETAQCAVSFSQAYHASLNTLSPPVRARVGVHVGEVTLRENSPEDAAQGARPFEVDGVALPVAARVMSLALGGQTLLSESAFRALGKTTLRTESHGHWRLKGLGEPVEIFEVGECHAPFVPPPDSAKAYRVVRNGNDWLPVRNVPHNLPAERDTFVGQDDTLALLKRRFGQGARLVTLVGIGGVGKTRLSLRHARSWLGDYPGGAWFCDLSAARSSDGIAHAVAQGLDVSLGKADAMRQLGSAIAGRGPCLVILDNFEQVARHAEETLGSWLECAPEARFVVTSREALGILGEQVLVVPPLHTAAAVNLFRQRVHALGVPAPTEDDDATIGPLVELLDRLPLAIELASARVRVMPPRVLLQRMGERFKLLATRSGRRDRQATLRAALDWSWDLLSPTERSALVQLSVFEGGFTLESAEAVIALPTSTEARWVTDVVQGLVEKSFVCAVGESRLGFLRTVLEYLMDRNATGDLSPAEESAYAMALRRHWMHFAEMSEEIAVAGRCAEMDNLMAACRRAATVDRVLAVKALVNVWAALRLHGPFRAISRLVEIIEAAGPHEPRQQSAIHRVVAGALHQGGDTEAAIARATAGLAIAVSLQDLTEEARAHLTLAEIFRTQGRPKESSEHAALSFAAAQSAGDGVAQVKALNSLGALHHGDAHYDLARSYYERALLIAEQLALNRWVGGLVGNLASIAFAQRRYDDALRLYDRALHLSRNVGDRQWEGNHRCNTGMLHHAMKNELAAITEIEEALRIARNIGHGRLERIALCNRGIIEEAMGKAMQALDSYNEAIALCVRYGDSRSEGEFRGYLGLLLARLGEPASSLREFARARGMLTTTSDSRGLALIDSQRAVAASLASDMDAARAHLADAEALIAEQSIEPTAEWRELIAEARQRSGDH